ncbi:hypothetical protein G3N96_03050 [Burkholderia sp. Se-20373]|uniref:hypothetical protein n=1 Tax=Burkholderia sp. Se-20373 TaxID=2703898 RepID=UPI00197DAF98|nr:hypothetical protein [Burkholderia sp. Se-20373]MBN3744418.1 hypothetical protein [Burkholderia sp. Se-20373]
MQKVMLIFCFCLPIFYANAEVEFGGKDVAPPTTADDVLKNILAIVDHGDLGDVKFYSEKLGVVMKGDGVGEVRIPDAPCGLSSDKTYRSGVGQYFYFSKIPWYFSSYDGIRSWCDRPYRKEFKQDGEVEIFSRARFDQSKICISEDNVKRFFKDGSYSLDRGVFEMSYTSPNVGGITLEMASTSQKPQCLIYVGFHQVKRVK